MLDVCAQCIAFVIAIAKEAALFASSLIPSRMWRPQRRHVAWQLNDDNVPKHGSFRSVAGCSTSFASEHGVEHSTCPFAPLEL